MLSLPRYSFGIGDRFAHQARAQLSAFQDLSQLGVDVAPVWNKSFREHSTIGSQPSSVREAAEDAVRELNWRGSYFVDADHIRFETVDAFIESSDFFTLDVADFIGQNAGREDVEAFINRHQELIGDIQIPNITQPFHISRETIKNVACKYLQAAQSAGKLSRHIAERKTECVIEVSMDETDAPQTPPELLIILAALADEKIPLQTIAPKFSGRFNKGVDYIGNVSQFEREFNDDLAVIAHAVKCYDLPQNLKLSVHSGSDKFSLYAPVHRALQRSGAGVHLKTAGTTWLEEVIGLAEAGGVGLQIAREIYARAWEKRDALCAPYASVIDIDAAQLPTIETVKSWDSAQFVAALRHTPQDERFNPHLRQLIHVGYKVAANMGDTYLQALREHETTIARNVHDNLLERHLKPLFLPQ